MIRLARLTDAPALQVLNQNELGYQFSESETAAVLAQVLADHDHQQVWVATDDSGQVVGYVHAQLYQNLYAAPAFNLLALAVGKDYQGQGYGRQLLDAIAVAAKERGLTGIRLNSGNERQEAHQFYKHLGFEKVKEQSKFYRPV
ncbi:GNAT family N-acetyltransferase [Leuconostocaceae bacterium ESL0723]|nr:GNAT family N-acetyltransferase [Leuconostocaceae bacterium ESL0723]